MTARTTSKKFTRLRIWKALTVNLNVTAGILISLATGPLLAQQDAPPLTLNGYGTLAVIHANETGADYVPNALRSEGAGRSGRWNSATENRAALQIDFHASSRLTATAQVIAEQDYGKTYRPRLEWANLRYDHSPALSVRLGRISLGTFMTSDYRKVGYALPWVRPPAEVYRMVSITNSDGMDVTYRFDTAGQTQHAVQLTYGRNKVSELDGAIRVPNMWGAYYRVRRGPLSLHASYLNPELDSVVFDELWDAYRAFGEAGEAVVSRYSGSGNRTPFVALGLEYDPGDWFVMTEWGRGDSRTDFGARSAWYVSGGYRLREWTPYLTYARSAQANREVDGLETSDFPPQTHALIAEINQRLELAQGSITPGQQTASVGIRWDVLPRASVKAQYDRVSVDSGTTGTFRNLVSPDYRPSGADVFSMTVDFLF